MNAGDRMVAEALVADGNRVLTLAELCAHFGEATPTRWARARAAEALNEVGIKTSVPLYRAAWTDPIRIIRPSRPRRPASSSGLQGPPATWLLVASRFSTRGLRHQLLQHDTVDWSVPSELRAGDLALVYERQKPERLHGPRGRKEIVAVLRALTDADATPYASWPYFATFAGVLLYPRLDIEAMRRDPRLRDWRALKINFQGASHEIAPETWSALLDLIDQRDRGAALDAEALLAGKDVPARGSDRVDVPKESHDEGEPADWVKEQQLTDEVMAFIHDSGAAARVTAESGYRPSEATKQYPIGNRLRADGLVVTGRGESIVIEVELYALGGSGSGVGQVCGYREILGGTGVNGTVPTGCVIAQDFGPTELLRAERESVECLAARRAGGAVKLRHAGGPVGPLTRALREGGTLEVG